MDRNSLYKELDEWLKHSSHFSDIINTHRTATAEIIAAIVGELVAEGQLRRDAVTNMLKRLDEATGRISADGSRRHLVSVIREALKGAK